MKKSLSILLLIFVMIVVLRLAGFTYGYYAANIHNNTGSHSVSVISKNLSVEYLDGTSIMNFDGDYLFPGDSAEKTFTVKNTGEFKATYNVLIDNVLNEFERTQDLRYVLYINDEEVTSGAINNNSIQYLYSNKEIDSGATDSVRFVFEYATTDEIQNVDMNKTISFRFNIDSNIVKFNHGTNISLLANQYINNYRIYGNSIQDGMPSDEAPVSIVSVGEKTVNLFNPKLNFNKPVTTNGVTVKYLEDEDCYVLNGTALTTSRIVERFINVPVVNGSKVSLSAEYVSGKIIKTTEDQHDPVGYFGGSDTPNSRVNFATINLQENNTVKENVTCNYNYVSAFWFYLYEGQTFDNYKVRIQLEEGSEANSYEPYGKYKVPVKVSGKNLFNVHEWFSNYLNNDGNLSYTNADYANVYKAKILEGKFKENTQYTISLKYMLKKNVDTSFGIIIRMNMSDGTMVQKRLPDASEQGVYTGDLTLTNSSNTTISSIRFAYNNSSYDAEVVFTDIQLEEGSTATEYEPYVEPIRANIILDEPLRKVGNHVDYIDFGKQMLIKNTEEIVLDGTTDGKMINQVSSNGLYYATLYGLNGINGASGVALNSHFKSENSLSLGNSYITSNGNYHVMVHPNQAYSDVTLWNEWLNSQYNQGTPVQVVYALAEEKHIPIKLPSLINNPIVNNNITIETALSPSNVEIESLKG